MLVGACGAGREVLALLDGGYQVVGVEPARTMVELARVRLGGRAPIYVVRYEELAADILGGRSGGGATFTAGPFDAVLLGWGSLSHVLDADERGKLIDALAVVCPTGPILASFLQVPPAGLPSPGRAQCLGSRLGRLARLMRWRVMHEDRSREVAHGDLGFTHVFAPAELEALATRIGRRALLGAAEFPGAGTAVFVLP